MALQELKTCMSKQRLYKLESYIKAVEELARRNRLIVRVENKKGSAVAFKVFLRATDSTPDSVWVIHTQHTRKREVWSKEDYRKPSRNLGGEVEDFLIILENI